WCRASWKRGAAAPPGWKIVRGTLARKLQRRRNQAPGSKVLSKRRHWSVVVRIERADKKEQWMKIWAVANQKGGVGKTTTSVALAGLLADVGKRVLVVDLDPHGSMTSYFGYNPDNLERTGFELFQHGGQVPEGLPAQLLQKTSHPRLTLLPASTALATLERQTPGKSGLGLVLSKALAQLWNDYDHVLIDSPPLLGVLMVNALAACQQLIVPVQTEFLAV